MLSPTQKSALHSETMWRTTPLLLAVLLTILFVPVTQTHAADEEPPDALEKPRGMWFPPNDFYPRYIADPLRPQNALTLLWLADTEIPGTGDSRFGLRLGGTFGIYRWHPEGDPNRGWQLAFDGGFAGQFDIDYSWDNTGWDGFYGLILNWKPTPELGFRIGTRHDSSHVGDEYMERTGQPRVHYTREEGILGVSWSFRPRWNFYGELGYGNGIAGSVTARVETGLQYISPRRYWKGRASWYAALDIQTYEETDWSTRLDAQIGYLIPLGDRSMQYRFAVEFGTGRSVMGQFHWWDETWLGIGWFVDF